MHNTNGPSTYNIKMFKTNPHASMIIPYNNKSQIYDITNGVPLGLT